MFFTHVAMRELKKIQTAQLYDAMQRKWQQQQQAAARAAAAAALTVCLQPWLAETQHQTHPHLTTPAAAAAVHTSMLV
jgi:hypothetical protein